MIDRRDFDRLWAELNKSIKAVEGQVASVSRQSARAEVAGAIEVVDALPDAGKAGRLVMFGGEPYYDDGTAWHVVGSGGGGGGDMLKAVYDTNDNGVVDAAEDADTLDGQHASAFAAASHTHTGVYAPVSHTHTESDITDLEHDAVKLQGIDVSTSAPSTGNVLTYNGSQWAPAAPSGGGSEIDGLPIVGTPADGRILRVTDSGYQFTGDPFADTCPIWWDSLIPIGARDTKLVAIVPMRITSIEAVVRTNTTYNIEVWNAAKTSVITSSTAWTKTSGDDWIWHEFVLDDYVDLGPEDYVYVKLTQTSNALVRKRDGTTFTSDYSKFRQEVAGTIDTSAVFLHLTVHFTQAETARTFIYADWPKEGALGAPGGRLTLTSSTPVTTSDVTSATTLYYTPYTGAHIGLYDGSKWVHHSFTERSISLSGTSANTNYDVFLYNNSGTLTLNLTAWSSDTDRATALVMQDGVYVKSGSPTHRYLGTIRTTSAGGAVSDNYSLRGVWNMYNREPRALIYTTSGSHDYNSYTWRPWNDSTSVRVGLVLGLPSSINGSILGQLRAGSAGYPGEIGIGLNSTTSPNAFFGTVLNANTQYVKLGTGGDYLVPARYHYLQALEKGDATSAPNFLNITVRGTVWG